MRMHWLGKLGAVVMALSPAMASAAAVAPHDGSFTDGECANCHSLYDPTVLGGAEYSTGCNACHANQTSSTLAFPTGDMEAKPGVGGTHHSWSGFAANPEMGAVTPPGTTFQKKLADGRLQCTVCHDLHDARPTASPNSRHTSVPVGEARAAMAGSTGSATMTLVNPGTTAVGYRLRLQSATSFIITKTARAAEGTTWLNWDSANNVWVPGSITGGGRPFTAGSPVPVEDATGVTVQWTTGGMAGDTWEFYVSYPGLRLSIVGDAMCTYCHKPMLMGHARVAGADGTYPVDGVRTFSHPVGEGLNSNALDTDQPEVLDANGLPQRVGDGNSTNDLQLDGGVVRCTSCHAVHGADSNSLTVDVR